MLALAGGAHVVLATPTGSGKSLVAVAAHAQALAQGQRSWYTAPIKALVSEKFFALVAIFGAEQVGMLTGDAAVNPGAPIICATAEVLANHALRDRELADIGLVVMDEFHFYTEPDRGWAWQVPLLLLPDTQFLLMSATLGDTRPFEEDLTRRTAARPSPSPGSSAPCRWSSSGCSHPSTRPSSCCCATTAARSTSCRSPRRQRSSRRRR